LLLLVPWERRAQRARANNCHFWGFFSRRRTDIRTIFRHMVVGATTCHDLVETGLNPANVTDATALGIAMLYSITTTER
jgi:hypothetical protein